MKRTILPTHILTSLLGLLFSISSHATMNVRSRFLSSENGLKANYIRSIVQDPRGYIWMGSTTGLIRYDGYTAEMMVPEKSPYRQLMLDERVLVVDVFQDRFIWMMVRGQKYCCYDTQAERFVDYTGNGTYEESFRHYHILSNGELWLSDQKNDCKVIRYDGEKFSSEKRPLNELPKEAIPTLPESHKSLLTTGRDLIKDNRGNLVVVSLQGELWHINKETSQVIHLSDIYSDELLRLNGSPRYSVVTDKDGIIWISTYGNGLFAHNPQTGETTHFLNNGFNISPIQTNYLLKLYEDKAGNIWACQENMGVAVISKQQANAESVFFTTSERLDHTNSIHLLVHAGESIYIGNRYNGLKIADGRLSYIRDTYQLSDDVVAICTDQQGNYWSGTRESGIFINRTNIRHQQDNPNSLTSGKISDIICDPKGRIWISVFDGGLDLAQPDGHGGYSFRHFFTGDDAIEHPRKMLIDHSGYLWLCSDKGVYSFLPDQLIMNSKAYQHYDIHTQPEESNEAHCIAECSENHIVIGTAGNGVITFDNSKPDQAKFLRRYTTDDGLPNNNVQQLVEDREGNVWIGTDNGLARYHIKTKKIMSLMPANTLQGNMFIENAVCLLSDGRVAFGSRHGITIIDPKSVTTSKPLFQLHLTDININGASIYDSEYAHLASLLNDGKGISLQHYENSLTFHFSDFDFDEGTTTKYTYRLVGYDKDWSPMSAYNFATYKNLPVGKYTMEVKAQNAFGEWNEVMIQMPITILPPWWRTWWAYLIYFILFTLFILNVFRQIKRINALRNRIKVEQQLTEFKMQFFTNISHEFRTPLTIIRGAAERMRAYDKIPAEMKQPAFSIQKSTERLMRMINQLLEFSKMHENKLHLSVEETEVVGFLRDIYSTFKDMAETKHISYLFTTNVKTITALIDRSYLDKIAYNLISNAFKYTPSHHDVTVRVKQDETQFRLIVEDTGVGIPKDKQKELFERFNQSAFSRNSIGIGLHLTNELVRVHHGTINYEENPKGGSIFTVSLPLDRSIYSEQELLKADSAIAIEEEENKSKLGDEYREMIPEPINKRKILIVEDDSDIRDYLLQELQRYFILDSANDGQEALEKIDFEKPELIITDAVMPIMNGFELIRRIRSNHEWNDIPIIMLTALTNEEDNLKGIKAGADAYIKKPFSPQMLVTRISKLLEQRDKLKVSYAKEVVGNVAIPEVLIGEADRRLREQMEAWMVSHISDTQVTAESFAQGLGYGRTNFFKKVKQLIGMSPNDYIKKIRMEKAAELLLSTNMTAAEIAYKVGFEDQYYFSKSFKKYYGLPPSQYRKGDKPQIEDISKEED